MDPERSLFSLSLSYPMTIVLGRQIWAKDDASAHEELSGEPTSAILSARRARCGCRRGGFLVGLERSAEKLRGLGDSIYEALEEATRLI